MLWYGLRPDYPETMSGDFRIAVAGFSENDIDQSGLGYELAEGVKLRLERDLQEISPGLLITVWGPERVGSVEGKTAQERAEAADALARRIHADMVIYGAVIAQGSASLEVLPEFFVSAENFYEAGEITGEHEFGSPIILAGASSPALRYEFGRKMYARGKALAIVAVGLAYFSLQDYSTALDVLQTTEEIDGLDDAEGKKVLYVLIGLAAGKSGEYDLAENAILHAIEIAPAYARPYIGMANLSYMRALSSFEETHNPDDIDLEALKNCFLYLDMAMAAAEKPPLADVDEKAHFSRGQCYFLQTYAGQLPSFELAKNEFEQVIRAYGNGDNERLRELAAESYARIGLMYNLAGDLETAVRYYQSAVDLFPVSAARKALYVQRIEDIVSQMTPTP